MQKYKQVLFFFLLISFFTIEIAVAEDAYEENDTFSTAATLAKGSYNLTLAANDDDWFKVSNLSPGLFHVKLEYAYTNPLDDLNVYIYNSSDQLVLAQASTGTEELFYHVIVAGDYYIKVIAASSGGSNNYTLSLNSEYTATSDDSDENNDNYDTSTVISDYNQPLTGKLAKDEDWYHFSSPPGNYPVTLTYDNTNGELDLEAYNALGNRLANTTGSSGQAQIEVDIGDAATIKLAVVGRNAASYTLTINHPIKWSKTLTGGPAFGSSPSLVDVDGDGKDEIIIGTVSYIDANSDEIRPAQLICLEDDGTIKWTQTFSAFAQADPVTGKIYKTSSISSRPAFGDIDGDGNIDLVIGVGVNLDSPVIDSQGNNYTPGQKGAVYALNAQTGAIKWSRISLDTIGGTSNTGDGLPDGVRSSPIICDMDQDGSPEIAWGGWDQYVYLVEGATGNNYGSAAGSKWPINVHDTNWSTPLCADINNDGLHELLIGGDVTENTDAYTLTGGLFHVYDRWGRDIINGFRELIEFTPNSGNFSTLKGKYEEQTIWSSPIAADLDGDGKLEIAYGTGTFKDEPVGAYIQIWNDDGTEYLKLATIGRTYATPLFTDLDNDGDLEIVAVTVRGYLHAWDHLGNILFTTQTFSSGGTGSEQAIYSAPLAVDLDNDGDLEIIFQQINSLTIVDHLGNQLTDPTKWGLTNEFFRGTPAIGDIDGDGTLEIVTGGSNAARDTGVIYAFKFGSTGNANSGNYRYSRRQFRESGVVALSSTQTTRRTNVSSFVSRFYTEVLSRTADAWGLADWTSRLLEGDKSGSDVAKGFVLSTEFINRNTTNSEFLTILYLAFFNRYPDTDGFNSWLTQLDSGTSRASVLDGFLGAQEFINLSNSFNISASFAANEGLNRVIISEFVERFYNQILQRRSDSAGLNSWVDVLMFQTMTGAEVASGFITSSEFVARGLDNTAYVKVLYRAFFGRSADTGGLTGWVDALNSNTLTRTEVFDGFTQSQEFVNLANSFGIIAY